MKNDIYATRERGDRQSRSQPQAPNTGPVPNVWVQSLRRQRIQNAVTLMMVFLLAGLLVFIGFQQSVGDREERGARTEMAPQPAPRVEPATTGMQIRPLAALPGEDERTGLMLDALRLQEPINLDAGDFPFHMEWVRQVTWHLLQAEEAHRNEEWERALDEYGTVLHMFPRMAGVHGTMGLIHMRIGNYPEALTAFEGAVSVEGQTAPLANNLGVVAMRLDDFSRALDFLNRAIQLDPNYSPAYFNLAVAQARMGNMDQASSQFRAYLRRAPDDLDGTLSFAALLIESRDWRGAAELLALADRMAPGTPPILFRLAQARAQTGQIQDALNALDRALERADARQALRWIGQREFDPLRDQPEFQRLLAALGEE